jgi:hypothetical protein
MELPPHQTDAMPAIPQSSIETVCLHRFLRQTCAACAQPPMDGSKVHDNLHNNMINMPIFRRQEFARS